LLNPDELSSQKVSSEKVLWAAQLNRVAMEMVAIERNRRISV